MANILTELPAVELGLLGIAAIAFYSYYKAGKGLSAGQNLPPGPKGLPVVGNLLEMPKEREWLTYTEWGRQYGGICGLKLLSRPFILLNSLEALEEFDKKGAIYSQRPHLPMGGELVGYENTLVLMTYGPRFRHYRKQFSKYIGNGAIHDKYDLIDEYTKGFLRRVAKDHTNLISHIRKLAGSVILRITYGYEVELEGADPFIDLIEHANENFNIASVPGAFVVDVFPSMKNLPEWLPGTGFLEIARNYRKATDAMVDVPYNWAKRQIASGTAPPSFVSTSIEGGDDLSEQERQDIKLVAASFYGGGADTTVAAEYAFYLAMVLYPEVQKKAQAEIDAVVGTDRLPNQSDAPNLPYVRAIVTEVLRWNTVAPSGVPHVAIEDGHVGGYFIPKDSMILANIWGILHNPDVYPEPFTFNPERFLGDNPQTQPRRAVYGFGRRICPGMYLAEASLFALVSMSLAAFEITNKVRDGEKIIPVHENTSGTISYPKNFECDIRPRSAKVLSLISE